MDTLNRAERLTKYLELQYQHILHAVQEQVFRTQMELSLSPDSHCQVDGTEPSVDIRLCVDLDPRPSWTLNIGDVSNDAYHSEFCAAGCIYLDNSAEELTRELIDQLTDEAYEKE